MLRPYLIFFCALISLQVNGQLSLDASRLMPSLGDTVFTSYYREEVPMEFFNRGREKIWNLNFIKAPYTLKESFQRPSKGKYASKFPEADLVLLKANNEEFYYSKFGKEFFCIGEVRHCTFTKSGVFVGKYLNPRKIINGKMETGARYTNDADLVILLANEDFNGKYTYIPFGNDSMKLTLQTRQSTAIDESGIMILNGEKNDVLRCATGTYTLLQTSVKKRNDKYWTEKKINPLSLPTEIRGMVSNARYNTFEFFTTGYKGPLLSYVMKDNVISDIVFQNKNFNPDELVDWSNKGEVMAYPNPTYGEISFELINMPQDNYRLEVYNILGKKLLTVDFNTYSGAIFRTDLSVLKKGTYLYSVLDGNGKKLLTRRLSLVSI